MKFIDGGVCAAKDFTANGIHCGIRKNKQKRDLSLIFSSTPAAAAAVYTTNLVKGAPLTVTKTNIENGTAQAIICNSGNANTCNANGIEIATDMCKITAEQLGINPDDVIVASTGVIGQPLDITPIKNGIESLCSGLTEGSELAAEGIMTTDTVKKQVAVSFNISGVECKLGGIAKGSGMIHPNMATMLCTIVTDAAVSRECLQKIASEVVSDTFNMISVDRDTSTNDSYFLLANGLAGNETIVSENEDYTKLYEVVRYVAEDLAKKMAADGEGATKLFEVTVKGAASRKAAKILARSVVSSNLVKAAIFGSDANWGRILCALGYSGESFDPTRVEIYFSAGDKQIKIAENGMAVNYSEEEASEILSEKAITITADLHSGDHSATAWGCDLTYDYVKINGDYRS